MVFLCGVTKDLIPHRSLGGSCNLEEERRLLYVGMTRAKDELLLLSSNTPSPFLADLPAESLLKEDSPMQRQAPLLKQLSLFEV